MQEYFKKDLQELITLAKNKKEELQTLKLQRLGAASKDSSVFRKLRQEIARIKTAVAAKRKEEAKA